MVETDDGYVELRAGPADVADSDADDGVGSHANAADVEGGVEGGHDRGWDGREVRGPVSVAGMEVDREEGFLAARSEVMGATGVDGGEGASEREEEGGSPGGDVEGARVGGAWGRSVRVRAHPNQPGLPEV